MSEGLIPLTDGQKASADDQPDATRQIINWHVDNNETIRQRPVIVNSDFNPGFYRRTTGTLTGIIGAYVWKSVFNQRFYLVYVRQDRTIWSVDMVTWAVTALSSSSDVTTQLDGSATQVTFAEDSQRLTMAGGGQLQAWTGSGLTSRIASTVIGTNQPPLSATHVVALSNYLIANNAALPGSNNQIFWSGLGDTNHVTWNPLNFNTADADPDPILALKVNLQQIFAFGTKTVQTFGIGSDPTLPFAAATSMVLGCGAAYSPIAIDGGMFAFLDSSRRFVITNGVSSQWISQDIDKLIRDFGTVSDCFGFRLRVAFWDLLVWVFPTEGKAYTYDQKRQAWYPWRGWNNIDSFTGVRIGCFADHPQGNIHIVGDPQFENLWTLNITANTDTGPGLPVVSDIVTQRMDHGLADRKRTERVRFFLQRGNSTGTSSTLDVSKRDDDGPWSARQQLDLGLQGDYRSFIDWFPGGIYRRRQYRIRYSGAASVSIARAVEYFEPYGA